MQRHGSACLKLFTPQFRLCDTRLAGQNAVCEPTDTQIMAFSSTTDLLPAYLSIHSSISLANHPSNYLKETPYLTTKTDPTPIKPIIQPIQPSGLQYLKANDRDVKDEQLNVMATSGLSPSLPPSPFSLPPPLPYLSFCPSHTLDQIAQMILDCILTSYAL